jgi:hypothetical protein
LTGEKGKGYWMPLDDNTKHETKDQKGHHTAMPSSPLGVIIEEVIQSIETVDMKLREFFEIHGTDLQISHELRSNDRRGK